MVTQREIKLDDRLFTEKEIIGRLVTVPEVMAELEKERLMMEESGGGVTFSGGEPLMQPRFLEEMLKACIDSGFHTAVDTSGYALISDLESILPYTSLFLYDLKMIDNPLHEQYTGVNNQIILENFNWLMQQGKPVRVRVPVVGGHTATADNISGILELLLPFVEKISQVDLLPYHRIGMHKYDKLGIPCDMPGEEAKMSEPWFHSWKEKFEAKGFKVKIGG